MGFGASVRASASAGASAGASARGSAQTAAGAGARSSARDREYASLGGQVQLLSAIVKVLLPVPVPVQELQQAPLQVPWLVLFAPFGTVNFFIIVFTGIEMEVFAVGWRGSG